MQGGEVNYREQSRRWGNLTRKVKEGDRCRIGWRVMREKKVAVGGSNRSIRILGVKGG